MDIVARQLGPRRRRVAQTGPDRPRHLGRRPGVARNEDCHRRVEWFRVRSEDNPEIESRIVAQKLLTPHYQHVDGTSFAAALMSGVVACMIQVNPSLTPARVKAILKETAIPLPDVSAARQGAGALRPAIAVARTRESDV